MKLVTGVIYKDRKAAEAALRLLSHFWGPLDFLSPALPFASTGYYRREMGEGLQKIFVSHRALIRPENLADIKVRTMAIERRLALKGCRTVNVDPGYLTAASVILATTKNFSHRIYLKKGIFAEVTLLYRARGRAYVPLEWTYPDFRTPEYLALMKEVRRLYVAQIQA